MSTAIQNLGIGNHHVSGQRRDGKLGAAGVKIDVEVSLTNELGQGVGGSLRDGTVGTARAGPGQIEIVLAGAPVTSEKGGLVDDGNESERTLLQVKI